MCKPRKVHEITKTAEEEGYTVTYRLIETKGQGQTGTVYSVAVSIAKGEYKREARAYDITRDETAARRILDTLHRNTVTPCTLVDVLEDIL